MTANQKRKNKQINFLLNTYKTFVPSIAIREVSPSAAVDVGTLKAFAKA